MTAATRLAKGCMDARRAGEIDEAYRLYLRLRALLRDTPRDHPARPHLVAAARATHRHWRDLRRPPEDRVLAVAPARAH